MRLYRLTRYYKNLKNPEKRIKVEISKSGRYSFYMQDGYEGKWGQISHTIFDELWAEGSLEKQRRRGRGTY